MAPGDEIGQSAMKASSLRFYKLHGAFLLALLVMVSGTGNIAFGQDGSQPPDIPQATTPRAPETPSVGGAPGLPTSDPAARVAPVEGAPLSKGGPVENGAGQSPGAAAPSTIDGLTKVPADLPAEAPRSIIPTAPTSGQPASNSLPHDLSPWGMFLAADIVVKAVMVGLAIASIVTWTVWFAKSVELWLAQRQLRRGIQRINGSSSLSEAAQQLSSFKGAARTLVGEADDEVERSMRVIGQVEGSGVQERVTSRLSRVEAAASRRMMFGTGVVATIGATAPFVGLFGTVWGIMNSFIGISQSQTTNLAVVAPGIAEALLATGIGLVAAIPAVIIYNGFANRIAGYRMLLADASAGVERLVSLDLDVSRLSRSSRGLRHGAAAE